MILRGYSVQEIPVRMRYRHHGTHMHQGIKQQVWYGILVLYTIVILISNHIFPHKRAD